MLEAQSRFHNGAILGLDVCARKPLVVTCGVDKTVRVWNYLEKTCELAKTFTEEAFSVAFHPSARTKGFQSVVQGIRVLVLRGFLCV